MPDWKDLRVDLGTTISLLILTATLVGVYWGMKARIEGLETKVAAQTAALEKANEKAAAHERALIELNVTLRMKGVMQ